jgi:hypothetical protein
MTQVDLSPAPGQPQPEHNVTPPPPMPASGSFRPAATAPALAYYPPLVATVPQPQKTMSVFGKIGIAVVSLLIILYAVTAPVPNITDPAEALGYRFGKVLAGCLFPFLIAYPIAGRRKARNPNLFAGIFCGIAFFILLANVAGSGALQTETNDQKVSRLMHEAAGTQPVRKPLFGEPKADTRLRDLFKAIISANKEYQQETEKVRHQPDRQTCHAPVVRRS